MSEFKIELNGRSWYYDDGDPLGESGGFGKVFKGRSHDDQAVAVKRLNIAENGRREVEIADFLMLGDFNCIIPIFASGYDPGGSGCFIVMALTETSLADYLRDCGGRLPEAKAAEIAINIANGLKEIGEIVHRDLKPQNVLRFGDTWRLADFGISRFVEKSTSINTMQEYMTPEYAAPEQWNRAHYARNRRIRAWLHSVRDDIWKRSFQRSRATRLSKTAYQGNATDAHREQ